MKKLAIGILAHVDAGKTTLSESMLYLTGKLNKLGRVDKKDAYLDNYELERARGITIFSKQAIFDIGNIQITLLDTPGHVDFSAEMERTLKILDYAILVISGSDGIQGHTKTLWSLLNIYQIPVFLLVNKMDQSGTDKNKLTEELKKQLDFRCVDFGQTWNDNFYDQLAMCNESLMEEYLEKGTIDGEKIKKAIKERKLYPYYFASALKLEGIEAFMKGIEKYTIIPQYNEEFGAKIFKITRDQQGNRLTHMKITGGKLKVKDMLTNGVWEEKVNQIRLYSGEKFQSVNEVEAGSICTVTGLTKSRPGEGLGVDKTPITRVLEPVLSYTIILPEGMDERVMIPKLNEIEEEEPELNIIWDEHLQEIKVQIMGEIQIEILQSIILDRFGVLVTFDEGRIVYKETIANIVEGVGHFEPLRHYAEVHLLLEPKKAGSGLSFEVKCSEDNLAKSWQRLILTHLEEKVHKGVLTGSAITDIKITLVAGKAHNKHTQGGDFREAVYRGVRQGLKEADSILLEPYYTFTLELPEKMVGRAMTDIEKMHGSCQISHTNGEIAVLVGSAPVITMRNYQKEVAAYTKDLGRLFCSLKGYEPCHNQEEVIKNIDYDSERDVENPTGSVFCQHGTGFLVNWNEVKKHMHIESYLKTREIVEETVQNQGHHSQEQSISLEEIDNIINSTFYANQGRKSIWKKQKTARESYYETTIHYKTQEVKDDYLLVDGYNIIYSWPVLKELAESNMDSARNKLLDILTNYQGIKKNHIIVVFDAYRVQGNKEAIIEYQNIHVVFTKESQTADQYIERFSYENQKKYRITVATSDGLQQIIIRGAGSLLLSARELWEEINRENEKLRNDFEEKNKIKRNYLIDGLSPEGKQQFEEIIKNED